MTFYFEANPCAQPLPHTCKTSLSSVTHLQMSSKSFLNWAAVAGQTKSSQASSCAVYGKTWQDVDHWCVMLSLGHCPFEAWTWLWQSQHIFCRPYLDRDGHSIAVFHQHTWDWWKARGKKPTWKYRGFFPCSSWRSRRRKAIRDQPCLRHM